MDKNVSPIASSGMRGGVWHDTTVPPVDNRGVVYTSDDDRAKILRARSRIVSRYMQSRANDLQSIIDANPAWATAATQARLSVYDDLVTSPTYTGLARHIGHNASGCIWTSEDADQYPGWYYLNQFITLLALQIAQITVRTSFIAFDEVREHPYNTDGVDIYRSLFVGVDVILVSGVSFYDTTDIDIWRMVVYRARRESRLVFATTELNCQAFYRALNNHDGVFKSKSEVIVPHVTLPALEVQNG